jgi:hypothetical protein
VISATRKVISATRKVNSPGREGRRNRGHDCGRKVGGGTPDEIVQERLDTVGHGHLCSEEQRKGLGFRF